MTERRDRARVRIRLSELMVSLENCCREAGIEFDEGRWSEHESNLDDLLCRHPVLGGRVFRLYGDTLCRTLYKNPRLYELGAVVLRNVHLVLDTSDWRPLLRVRRNVLLRAVL